MSTLPEQFSAARSAQVETQITLFQNYASSAVQKAEKLFALNMRTTRTSMEKSSAAMRQLMAAQDPRDLFALTTQAQASVDSLLAYGRELFSIASGAPAAPDKEAAPVVAPPVAEVPSIPQAPRAAPAPAAPLLAKVGPPARAARKASPVAAPAPEPVLAAPPKTVQAAVPAAAPTVRQSGPWPWRSRPAI